MRRVLASVAKELLLLRRDRATLAVLFLMPSLLVVVITLVQESVMKSFGHPVTQVLLVDEDQQSSGQTVERELRAAEGLEVLTHLEGIPLTSAEARRVVMRGEYPLCVIVPDGMTRALQSRAQESVQAALAGSPPDPGDPATANLLVYFDPVVREGFRSVLRSALQRIVLGLTARERAAALGDLLPGRIASEITRVAGPFLKFLPPTYLENASKVELSWAQTPVLEIEARTARTGVQTALPTSSQQNIPAWALFGMFFVMMPMAGALIKERAEGTILRLTAAPTPAWTRLVGMLVTYAFVCLAQFSLVLIIGTTLLPALGSAALELGRDPVALVVIAASASLAAAGFGLLVGTAVRTYQQASAFGPLAIVIAAALGGVMVPAYLMPHGLKVVGRLFPLAWGQEAFLTILVRGGGLADVLPMVGRLLGFSAATVILAGALTLRRERSGLWTGSTSENGF